MNIRPTEITRANYIGVSRIVLWTPLATAMMLREQWAAAAVAIVMSGVSDVADGVIARRENTISTFGVFLDLTADKVFVSALFISLAAQGLVPLWAVLTIVVREFLVMGLRAFAAAESTVITADKAGGAKIIATFLAILAVVLHLAIAPYLVVLAVVLTIVSGLRYAYGS